MTCKGCERRQEQLRKVKEQVVNYVKKKVRNIK